MALPDAQRLVIACRYLLDLDEEETAAVLGVARGTVKSRAHRGLRHLRRLAAAEPAGPLETRRGGPPCLSLTGRDPGAHLTDDQVIRSLRGLSATLVVDAPPRRPGHSGSAIACRASRRPRRGARIAARVSDLADALRRRWRAGTPSQLRCCWRCSP